ncbi:MAG TPA: chloride channel protein [Candidatus Saccharimonadales bacterium]|nr:chloride channel protein [Candidatus Saccharimonadales bacterium]
MRKHAIWWVAAGLGVANAILLRGFELAVNDGTNWLWNDVFRSNVYRWVVVPLAVALSIALSWFIYRLHEQRVVAPDSNLTDELSGAPANLGSIGIVLAIGLASLLAGASLGPEASLMTAAAGLGSWAAVRGHIGPGRELLVLASVGALLVAFLGSGIMVTVPLLILWKQKQFKLQPAAVILLAGLSSLAILHVIDPHHPGFGSLPPMPAAVFHDFVIAPIVGCAATVVALVLTYFIARFTEAAKRIDQRCRPSLAAALFGLGVGLLYLLGGESIQFSGSVGAHQLVQNAPTYSLLTVAGLLLAKLLATSWSKGSGYRGGLVFPSIYMGTALGLLVAQLNAGWAGVGASVGGIAGMLTAVVGSPVLAAVFLIAIVPLKSLLVALLAVVGSTVGATILKRSLHRPER